MFQLFGVGFRVLCHVTSNINKPLACVASVSVTLPARSMNFSRKLGHPVLKHLLHEYELQVAISSSRFYIIFLLLKSLKIE